MGKKLDKIGIWSEAKLDIVRDYATEYSRILSKKDVISRHVYIDAFAGAGVHISKSTGEYVPGSPQNALLVDPPFSAFHFIDLDEERAQGLQEIADERSDVFVYQGDCNQVLINEVFKHCEYEDYARGLCLLDPYKLSVNWEVLQSAGQMKTIEIFYNFMIMDANRNVLWKNPDAVSEEQLAPMNAVWGDDSWRNIAYRREQRGLFDREFIEDKASNREIAEAFRIRLRDVAGFSYVPKPIPMKNATGATIYYLYFASQNPVAKKIVEHVFRKHELRAGNG